MANLSTRSSRGRTIFLSLPSSRLMAGQLLRERDALLGELHRPLHALVELPEEGSAELLQRRGKRRRAGREAVQELLQLAASYIAVRSAAPTPLRHAIDHRLALKCQGLKVSADAATLGFEALSRGIAGLEREALFGHGRGLVHQVGDRVSNSGSYSSPSRSANASARASAWSAPYSGRKGDSVPYVEAPSRTNGVPLKGSGGHESRRVRRERGLRQEVLACRPPLDSAGISVLLTALMSSPRQRHAGAMRLRRDRRLPPRRGSPPRRPSAERTGRLHLTSTQYDLISRAILASLMHSPGRVPLGRFLPLTLARSSLPVITPGSVPGSKLLHARSLAS